jgi:two-component system response regulator NreC
LKKLRILLADDHTMLREGLKLLVNGQPDMEVVGEAGDGGAALQKVLEVRPDVAVMDFSMPGLDGAQATERLKRARPEVKVLALTRHDDSGSLHRMLQAGASGYVLKQAAARELLTAIRAVAAGGFYIDAKLHGKLVRYSGRRFAGSAPHEDLSEQQREVLRRYAMGYSIKEIAAQLDISPKTVETHKARAEEKLELRGRADIVAYAIREGWLTRQD